MNELQTSNLVYLGPAGRELAWRMAGITVQTCDTPHDLVVELKHRVAEGAGTILFVDEELAVDVQQDIERLNSQALPAIVLVPTSSNPQNLTQAAMNNLMIQAVGSDIFSN